MQRRLTKIRGSVLALLLERKLIELPADGELTVDVLLRAVLSILAGEQELKLIIGARTC